jgi:hypothetical protein
MSQENVNDKRFQPIDYKAEFVQRDELTCILLSATKSSHPVPILFRKTSYSNLVMPSKLLHLLQES